MVKVSTRKIYLFIRKSHNITKAICHFLTVPNVQFQFLNLHREEERISQGAEYCTSRKKEHLKLKHHI